MVVHHQLLLVENLLVVQKVPLLVGSFELGIVILLFFCHSCPGATHPFPFFVLTAGAPSTQPVTERDKLLLVAGRRRPGLIFILLYKVPDVPTKVIAACLAFLSVVHRQTFDCMCWLRCRRHQHPLDETSLFVLRPTRPPHDAEYEEVADAAWAKMANLYVCKPIYIYIYIYIYVYPSPFGLERVVHSQSNPHITRVINHHAITSLQNGSDRLACRIAGPIDAG